MNNNKIFDELVLLKILLRERDSRFFEDNRICRSVFLGNVFELLPSRKFYCVLSSSNLDICESCQNACDNSPCDEDTKCTPPENYSVEDDGEYHCEFCRDQTWIQQAEKELREIGCSLASGEGDPCDYFAEIVFDTEEDEQDWIKEMKARYEISNEWGANEYDKD